VEILVDSNVILDVLTEDPQWFSRPSETLSYYADNHILVINPIIYAEVSIGFELVEEVEKALPPAFFRRDQIPWEAAFLAGKCFLRYRRQGGKKAHPLLDFFIGAHAAIAGMPLITRDTSRYRTYFTTLRLIAPKRSQ
jgi:predicted nucleic acid-binding protein